MTDKELVGATVQMLHDQGIDVPLAFVFTNVLGKDEGRRAFAAFEGDGSVPPEVRAACERLKKGVFTQAD